MSKKSKAFHINGNQPDEVIVDEFESDHYEINGVTFSYQKPPNWQTLVDAFGVEWGTVLVTYGEIVYCGIRPTLDLAEHERLHVKQQAEMGVEQWWARYLEDPQFRYSQELSAYRAQYQYLLENTPDRNVLAQKLHIIAGDLSSAMYGGLVSHSEAVREIKAARS